MSEQTTAITPAQPFGIANVAGTTFRIYGQRFWLFSLIGFASVFIAALIEYGLAFLFAGTPGPAFFVITIMTAIVSVFTASIGAAVAVRIAYNTAVGEDVSLTDAIATGLRRVVPLAVLSLMVAAFTILGAILLVVPGLYIQALYAVLVPALVVEDTMWRSGRRSAELTKGYRWPIVAIVLLIFIASMLISGVAIFAATPLTSLGISPLWANFISDTLISSLLAAAWAVATTTIYMRLREIKDGVRVEDIVGIFK